MRKPRDYDAELAALDIKTRELRGRKLTQLGELVIACKADTLAVEVLAGALLEAGGERAAARKEAWRAAGAAMFQQARRSARAPAQGHAGGAAPESGGTLPPAASAKPE